MTRVRLALLVWVVLAGAARGDVFTLYDGSLNSTPNQQNWAFRFLPLVPPVSQSVANGATTLDTSGNLATQAGYFTTDPLGVLPNHPALPVLNRGTGFTIRFDVRVRAENHGARVDRAGFSILALASDRRGIELGFWENEVWAQADDPLFTHAEGASFNTTNFTRYDLSILGNAYQLFADGTLLLAGAVRDYSAFGLPYSTPNQVFLGDDTTSAGALIDLAFVSASTQAVPEPASLLLVALGGLALAHRVRSKPR